jgi:hypothetical protein
MFGIGAHAQQTKPVAAPAYAPACYQAVNAYSQVYTQCR